MSDSKQPYRVLARKYRPQNFDELIGQDALVRTLKNAIESGRIAHAFMLTGIRGTGKTTTARIIAKALNYTGADGKADPTTGATDDCEICQAIAEDRHPDVMEMDAATRTSVDDIREILDGVRYAPTAARYKIYIIDEVHMLSKAAFNALLKTLEEPPEHVKFIFATTEIRKVPVTVLSRCQRFDLRRVDAETLKNYYGEICEKEQVKASDDALMMISRAADGSVRDGLSLLDQAIAMATADITADQVQDMLGLADRTRTLDIFEHGVKGECSEALDVFDELHKNGADPLLLLQDMMEFTHLLTKARVLRDNKNTVSVLSPDMQERISSLSAKLSMPTLSRAWQILLKGLQEVNSAQNTQAALEMIIIRLAYAADLPDPSDLLKKIKDSGDATTSNAPQAQQSPPERTKEPVAQMKIISGGAAAGARAVAVQEETQPEETPQVGTLETLEDVERLLSSNREMILAGEVFHNMHVVDMKPGHIEFRPSDNASPKLASELGSVLKKLTGERWVVSVSGGAGQPTLAMQKAKRDEALLDDVKAHPVVKNVLEIFPDAEVRIKTKQ